MSRPPSLRWSHAGAALAGLAWLAAAASSQQAPVERSLGNRVVAIERTLLQLGAHVRATPAAQRDVADTAWLALCFSANGANMRMGHHKHPLRERIAWLRRGLDERSEPHVVGEATPREAHLLALLAVARTHVESDYKLLQRAVQGGWRDVRAKFTAPSAPPPTADEAALLVMFAETAQHTKWPGFGPEALDLARGAVAAIPRGRDKLADAVRHQLERLAGTPHPPDLTLAMCWPGDVVQAPKHAFFAAFVTRSLPPTFRRQQWAAIERVIANRADDGFWDVPDQLDRCTGAAIVAAVLGISHEPDGFAPKRPQQGGGGTVR
ncbi:MAG: hypothetical protein KAI24_02660 [Planctomycetes bacterium]|nr:hypothetical protein [Planctomycetota bacterium]